MRGLPLGGQICGHFVVVGERRTDSTHAADRPDVWRIGGFTPTSFCTGGVVRGRCFSVAVGSRPREKEALLTWPFAVEKTEEEDAAKERGLRC
jgi:hypothetical protein